MVEGARLESVFRGNSNVGSNPTLSAIKFLSGLETLVTLLAGRDSGAAAEFSPVPWPRLLVIPVPRYRFGICCRSFSFSVQTSSKTSLLLGIRRIGNLTVKGRV